MKLEPNKSVLSDIEWKVWNILKDRTGYKNAITSKQIRKRIDRNISRNALCKIVQNLRLIHKIPIASSKYGEYKGYFIPKNKEEIEATIDDFITQAERLLEQVDVFQKAFV